jgi:hypothetical protein
MIKYMLGLTPVGQGFKKMELSIPVTDIEWAEGSIPTPHGRIDVYWSREAGMKKFRARVPSAIEIVKSGCDGWNVTIERI